jgi:phage tail-like protein
VTADPGKLNPLTADERVGVALYFDVKVDGRSLGWFTGVKGLIAEHEVFEWAEGGENGFVHRLPGRLKYRDITLSRCTDPSTVPLANWVDAVRSDRSIHSGAITAYDAEGKALVVYKLRDVWPIRYSGPVLDTVLGGLARETLDLAHSGFTVCTPPAES